MNPSESPLYLTSTLLISLCSSSSGVGGFLPAMKQIGNVAALPGIVNVSVAVLYVSTVNVLLHTQGVSDWSAEIHRPARCPLWVRICYREHGGL